MVERLIIYECDICGGYHPWNWDGDCREDAHRWNSPEEYADAKGVMSVTVEVRTMDERVEADGGPCATL